MIKHKIDTIMFIIERDPFLAGLKTKPVTQLKQKQLDVIKERAFQIRLTILVTLGQACKLKDIRVTNGVINARDLILGLRQLYQSLLIPGKACPFIKLAFDL